MIDKEKDTFSEAEDIASFTECTGLMPALPDTMAEDKNLSALYGIHSAKKPRKKLRDR